MTRSLYSDDVSLRSCEFGGVAMRVPDSSSGFLCSHSISGASGLGLIMRRLSEMLFRIECCELRDGFLVRVKSGDFFDRDRVLSSACDPFSSAHRFAVLYEGLE